MSGDGRLLGSTLTFARFGRFGRTASMSRFSESCAVFGMPDTARDSVLTEFVFGAPASQCAACNMFFLF